MEAFNDLHIVIVPRGNKLVKFAMVVVMITNYVCCLNEICMTNTIMFDGIWVLTSQALEAGANLEAQPHI